MAEELENARIDQLPKNVLLKGNYPFPIITLTRKRLSKFLYQLSHRYLMKQKILNGSLTMTQAI